MSDEVVRLRGVGVRRGGSALLRDVDWTVHDDERWVIIGPNGAGKTTLLQVAGGQLFPTEGSAEILGERLGETGVFEPAAPDRAGQRGGSRPGATGREGDRPGAHRLLRDRRAVERGLRVLGRHP